MTTSTQPILDEVLEKWKTDAELLAGYRIPSLVAALKKCREQRNNYAEDVAIEFGCPSQKEFDEVMREDDQELLAILQGRGE